MNLALILTLVEFTFKQGKDACSAPGYVICSRKWNEHLAMDQAPEARAMGLTANLSYNQ